MKKYHTMSEMPYDGGNNLTDWELAVSHWLPHIWTPGRMCAGPDLSPGKSLYCEHEYLSGHSISCPPLTRDLAMRLLETMLRNSPEAIRLEFMSELFLLDTIDGPVFDGPDLLTAIIKAAAALAEKDQ